MSFNAAAAPQNIFHRLFSPGLYDVYIVVLAHCSPASLYNLAKTCRSYRAVLLPLFPYLWDINRHLKRFFSDPVGFRNLQARTATLISGSSALQFLDRNVYEGSDLDLYVYNESTRDMCEWIIGQGYVFVPKVQQDPDFDVAVATRPLSLYRMRGVRNIIDLEHPSNGRKVQVIAAESCPMEIVLHFHSTCVMNVISFSHAYSLYPTATFEHRTSLICASLGPSHAAAQQKYRERGWRLLPGIPSTQLKTDLSSSCSIVPRWIADRFAWVLPLNMDGVACLGDAEEDVVPLTVDPVVMTTWQLAPSIDEGVRIVCEVLMGEHRNCRYSYALSDKSFWANFMYWFTRYVLVKMGELPEPESYSLRFDGAIMPRFERHQKTLSAAVYSSVKSISVMTEAIEEILPCPVTADMLQRTRNIEIKRIENTVRDLTQDVQRATAEGLGEFREQFAWFAGWDKTTARR